MLIRRAVLPLLPLVLVASAALTSCGGDDDSSGDGGPKESPSADATDASDAALDACALVSADDVAAAVGAPVKEGVASTGPAITGGTFATCVWQSDDPEDAAALATLTLYPNTDAADEARKTETDAEDVDGVGDKAFAGSFSSMWVYVGDRSFFTQWYSLTGTDDENDPKTEALAKAVAEAL